GTSGQWCGHSLPHGRGRRWSRPSEMGVLPPYSAPSKLDVRLGQPALLRAAQSLDSIPGAREFLGPQRIRDSALLPGLTPGVLLNEDGDPGNSALVHERLEPGELHRPPRWSGFASDDVPANRRQRRDRTEHGLVAHPPRAGTGQRLKVAGAPGV